jgi:hypothetical protein
MIMINSKTVTSALGLGLALGLALASATPALAKDRASPPGYAARAQAVPGQAIRGDAGDGVGSQRAKALRECNELAGKYSQSTWGNMSSDQYRACMAQHGEVE